MAIARAVLEWCANPRRLGAKTLFATHYHELTVLEGQLPGVKNYNIAARKRKDEILFLRKIVPRGPTRATASRWPAWRGCPQTHPPGREILQELENQEVHPKRPAAREAKQVSLTALGEEEVLSTLRSTPVENLTPIQALNLLYELKGSSGAPLSQVGPRDPSAYPSGGWLRSTPLGARGPGPRLPGGGPHFSRNGEKERGASPWTPGFMARLLPARSFLGSLSLIRWRAISSDILRPIWDAFSEKYAEKAFYERKVPNQGTYIGAV